MWGVERECREESTLTCAGDLDDTIRDDNRDRTQDPHLSSDHRGEQ